jgi:hypothetical protein
VSTLWTKQGPFGRVEYDIEADLESAILQVQGDLFGRGRIYVDVRKRIGKGDVRNILDGYLLDLGGKKPQLYVVENELACHDPLRHIAVQILQISLSWGHALPKPPDFDKSYEALTKLLLIPNAALSRCGSSLS